MHGTLGLLACAARGLGQRAQMRIHLVEALRIAVEIANGPWPPTNVLLASALYLADQGQTERAVEVYALTSEEPDVANSVWFEDVAGKHVAAAAESLPPEVVAAAQERGRAGDYVEVAEELLAELEPTVV